MGGLVDASLRENSPKGYPGVCRVSVPWRRPSPAARRVDRLIGSRMAMRQDLQAPVRVTRARGKVLSTRRCGCAPRAARAPPPAKPTRRRGRYVPVSGSGRRGAEPAEDPRLSEDRGIGEGGLIAIRALFEQRLHPVRELAATLASAH